MKPDVSRCPSCSRYFVTSEPLPSQDGRLSQTSRALHIVPEPRIIDQRHRWICEECGYEMFKDGTKSLYD